MESMLSLTNISILLLLTYSTYFNIDIDEGIEESPEYCFVASRKNQRGVRRDHVDLVLDTASVSNVFKPEDAVLLSDVAEDPE